MGLSSIEPPKLSADGERDEEIVAILSYLIDKTEKLDALLHTGNGIASGASLEATPKQKLLLGVIKAKNVRLRSEPGVDSATVTSVGEGARFIITNVEGEWVQVLAPTGAPAWVAKELIEIENRV